MKNHVPGTFKIEKNVGCKYTVEVGGGPEKNIDLVLNTCTGEIENVICNAKYAGKRNKNCLLLEGDCPYMKDKEE